MSVIAALMERWQESQTQVRCVVGAHRDGAGAAWLRLVDAWIPSPRMDPFFTCGPSVQVDDKRREHSLYYFQHAALK